jgi:hypothetical protein
MVVFLCLLLKEHSILDEHMYFLIVLHLMHETNSFFQILVLCVLFTSCKDQKPQTTKDASPIDDIIISVNAYSFNDVLMARSKRDGHQVYTLFNLLDWCASKNIKALDPPAYFFQRIQTWLRMNTSTVSKTVL